MYQNTAKGLAALGRNGDSMLMHVNPTEVAALSQLLGPVSTNPKTGLPEAYGWSNLIGSAIGGIGSFGIGESLAPIIGDAVGEGLMGDILKKAVPALAGAGFGAAIGGATGGKAGAMGGALQGGMSGGLGAYAAEDVFPQMGAAPEMKQQLNQDAIKNTSDSLYKASTAQPSLYKPEVLGQYEPKVSEMPVSASTDFTPDIGTSYSLQGAGGAGTGEKPGFFDNLGTAAKTAFSKEGFKKYEDYIPYLFQAGMIGNAVTAEQDSKDAAQQAEEDARNRIFLSNLQATNLARQTYGYAGGGYVERPSDEVIKQMLNMGPTMYGSQEHHLDKRPLNVQNLIDAGAMRITYPGDGTGSYDPNLEGYSIVSRVNDVGDPMTRGWPDKPDAYGDAAKSLTNPDMLKQLSDAKYKQLIDSAAAVGLSPKDIYSGYAGGGPVVMQGNDIVPIQVRIPEHLVDKVKSAGGMPAYTQGLGSYATGGYINLQPMGDTMHPQGLIPKAQPYPAATPQRREVVQDIGDTYAEGGLIDGEGDGMSDDIDANIEGREPVRVADGEVVVPKHVVDMIGVDRLDELLRSVRMAAYGREDQINEDAGLKAAKKELGLA